jgi:hypothetical protein
MRLREAAIRRLAHEWWQDSQGMSDPRQRHIDFDEFRDWLYRRGLGSHLEFEAPEGAYRRARAWFEDELSQP